MADKHTERTPAPLRGYRVLSDQEKATVDAIKLTEAEVAKLWQSIEALPEVDRRALVIAKTEFQTAFMWFVRAVTRPLDVFQEETDRG